MKRFLLLLLFFVMGKTALAQIPEAEPNNTPETASPLARYEQKTATVNNTTDVDDYYRAVLPEDGTLKIYVRATCTGAAGTGWLYFNAYDRRKVNSISERYIANNTSIPSGVTVYDTITLYGMAADTVYLRFYTSKSFSYQLSYSITDQTVNDAEPNNTVVTALPIAINETRAGHQHYFANGDTYDDYDYYRAVLPADGTLKLYVDATNQGGGTGWMYLNVYDRRKVNSIYEKYLGNNTSIPRGTSFKDTITLYGMAADTVYFRLYTSGTAFSYSLKYNQTDLTTNDAELNNTVANALPISINETKQGHQHYFANGDTYDDYDYYRAILPADGTLKLYVDATNQGGGTGWMYLDIYDRRKVNSIFGKYLAGNTSIPRGTSIKDTITLYGFAADTVYFRFYTSGAAFSYSLRYSQTDLTPNDVEPNGTPATALPLALGETKQGHQHYFANGDTYDSDDYYRITPPYDGTHKMYIEATNQGSGTGWLYINVYDRRKVNSIFEKFLGNNTSIPRGATIRDTITLYGQAADTGYFRLYTNGNAFSYKIRYDVVDTSTVDTEPNNTFATALDLSGSTPRRGHINYAYNGTTDGDDYYKTGFASSDSLKLYIQATNNSGTSGHFYVYGYNAAQSNIYTRERYSVPVGATIFDSVKIAVTAPQTIYNRVYGSGAFSYQLSLNSRLPGNGFSISGKSTACTNAAVYKAINMAPSDAGVVYHWSVNGGGTLTFTDSIATVNWTTAGTWIVSLYTSNTKGNSVTKQLAVTVTAGSPPAAPIITAKGRYLDIAALPTGASRQWYKNGVAFSTDSVIYAATAGSYTAKYVNDCGESSPSAAIIMNTPQAQTISFPAVPAIIYSTSPDTLRKLVAIAFSGLPVTYKIISGPGVLSNDTLRPTGYGSIVVQAMQFGSATYSEASPVDITVNVTRGFQAIIFDSIPNKIYTANASFALSATASSGLPVSFQVVSGPATVSGSLLTLTGVGTVQVKAMQTGGDDYGAAAEKIRSFCIGLRQIKPITGPSPACIGTQRYITRKITGAVYQWSLDGGGILTTRGDTAIVQWQTGGNHALSIKGYSTCDTVRSAAQTLTVFVDTAYTVTAPTGLLPANGSTGLSKPLTLSWTASPKATAYDIYVWPNGYAQPPIPLDSNLATVTYTVNDNIALNQPYNWRVVAKNICTSAASAVQQFTVSEINNTLPDLVLDTFYFSQPLYQGQPVTVTWRVKNTGTKGTGINAWKDRIYLSYSSSIRGSESTLLGAFDNPSYLLPGESYTQTKTVTIPPGYGGTWWLSVITDNEEAFCFTEACNIFWGPRGNHRSQSVDESNELNNYRYAIVTILDGPLPDLQVQSIGAPGALFSGSQFTLTYKVKNAGTAPASGKVFEGCPQRAWRDRFFITTTPDFNIATARELGQNTVRFLQPGTTNCDGEALPYKDFLLPDSSYTAQQMLTIPYQFYGKQYFWVYANGYNDAYEGPFNTNNLRRTDSVNITITPPADLVVSAIQNISTRNSGDRVDITYTITNQGANAPQEENWSDSIWICSSPSFSYASVVASGSRGARRPDVFGTGSTYSNTIYLYLPNGISGTYYVFAKTDAQREVFEFDQEGNNQSRGNAFTVNIGPLYDLLVTSIAAPDTVTAGTPFNISLTVKNSGSSTLSASRWDYLFARTTTTPDVTSNDYVLRFLQSANDTLLPGGQRTYTGQAVISTYSQTVGRLAYLQAITDGNDGIYEHNAEGNNIFVRTTPVFVKPAPAPPLVDRRSNPGILSFTAPASATGGDTISFSWTVKNKGPLATSKTYWYDRLLLSSDTIASIYDTYLKDGNYTKATTTGLLPDSSYTISGKGVVPYTASGTWYFLLRSDAGSNIENDSTDSDNVRQQAITISVPPVPNLVITPLNNLPDSVFGGSAFYLKYKVQNTGPVATGPYWFDRAYIATGNVPEGYGLASNNRTTPLVPGASYTDSLLVKVPAYFNGAYSIILHTDGRDEVYEGPTGNADNLNVRPKFIYPYNTRPAADLLVQSVTVPDSVVLGKDLTTSFVVKNAGQYPAAGNLTNALYLSSNAVFESDLDKLTATAELPNILLQPGQSFTTQLTGKALPPTGGRYRSIIRTNSRNTLWEGPYITNNIKASDTSTYIEARSIPLATNVADTLIPNYGNYYKVTVAAGQDLLVSLNTAYSGNGSTALYVGYNRVPTATDYDITGVNPVALNQQALLSNTQAGTYYIRTESFGIPVSVQATLRVDAIPYSIISAAPAIMGQGVVTGAIRGGGFKPTTQVVLRKSGTTYNVATVQQFINSTQLIIRWDLTAMPLGQYDVVAINPGGAEAVLANGITVETTRAYKLEYTPLLPQYVRPFGGVFTYKGKNIGNVNIPVLQGDITMIEKNAQVHGVTLTGRIRRYTQYIPQYDSLLTDDWYLSGKNRVVPFFGRNIAPGEEFTITIDLRFKESNVSSDQKNVFPLQCRMFGYSSTDFAREEVRKIEMLRLILVNDPRSARYTNSPVIQGARIGSKFFAEIMLNEYVAAGLMNWSDTMGTAFRWDCSRCIRGLPEVRPANAARDTFTYKPGGLLTIGKDSLGTGQVFRSGQSLLIEINKGRYWDYYDGSNGAAGKAGNKMGWDLLHINGTLFIDATVATPFKIYFSSLGSDAETGQNKPYQLGGWNPAYDTIFPIVIASGGIGGFEASKFDVRLNYFATLNNLRRGHFSTELRRGYGLGADSLVLKWTAYKPGPGEIGVDGVDGAPGEPGSPGGKGGSGDVARPTGGKGGRGGNGGNEYVVNRGIHPAGIGGRGGDGGDGYGSGGDGGDAGQSGTSSVGQPVDGATGGKGGNAGPNGGTGGNGGKGGNGGGGGGKGGNGGPGGTASNSSYGGIGGDGGDGGQGTAGCNGGKQGGDAGIGGTGGNGSLGAGSDGISGQKGKAGPSIDCPPCSALQTNIDDAKKSTDALIDYGKAVYGAADALLDGDITSPKGIYLEWLNQSETENTPSVKLIVQCADFIFDAAAHVAAEGATIEWTLGCKAVVTALKIGDYAASNLGYTETSGLRSSLFYLTEGISAVSSVPDFVAFALKQANGLMAGLAYSIFALPCDPNQITGPAGYGQPKFVSRNLSMPYVIDFENDSTLAQVAAQRVIIRQSIHPKADPLAFKLGSFGFASNTFAVPEDRSNYFTTLNFDSLGYRVNVTAGVDIVKREAFWIFQTIDPATGLPPTNVFLGLLPVNDSLNRGHGFVKYAIKPLATDATGDSITAKASIVFDENEPVETNTWANVVDAYAPMSSLSSLPATSNNPVISLHYSGTDDTGGSGLKYKSLYVSDNSGEPMLYVANWSGTDTVFYGEQNHTYTFYGEATDNVANREERKNMGSVAITANSCLGNALSFTSDISGSSYQWQVNTGSGWANVSEGDTYTSTNSKTLVLINATGPMYGYQYRALVNGNTYNDVFTLRFATFWEGGISRDWNNPANWSCGTVPNQYTDVVIPGGKERYPEVTGNPVIRTLRANPGATVTVKAGAGITVLK